MSNRRVRKAKEEVKYLIRAGTRIGKADPQEVGAALQQLHTIHGRLDADLYVETAKDKHSPLHPTLEWNDSKAAQEYRLQCARTIIRAVVIVTGNKPSRPVYVHVDKERGYQLTEVVVRDMDMFAAALSQLQRKASEALRAVQDLKAAAASQPEKEAGRMARISIAIEAFQAANQAVAAIH